MDPTKWYHNNEHSKDDKPTQNRICCRYGHTTTFQPLDQVQEGNETDCTSDENESDVEDSEDDSPLTQPPEDNTTIITAIAIPTSTPMPPARYHLNGTNGPPPDYYLQNEQINATFANLRECNGVSPSLDPIQTAMTALDNVIYLVQDNETIDKYLLEPQSFKAVLHLDPAL